MPIDRRDRPELRQRANGHGKAAITLVASPSPNPQLHIEASDARHKMRHDCRHYWCPPALSSDRCGTRNLKKWIGRGGNAAFV